MGSEGDGGRSGVEVGGGLSPGRPHRILLCSTISPSARQ